MRITQTQAKLDALLAACAARGIKVTKHEHHYSLRGAGVDVLITNLSFLNCEKDLEPAYGARPNI